MTRVGTGGHGGPGQQVQQRRALIVAQALQQLAWLQRTQARSGQLDGQRHAAQQAHQAHHGQGVVLGDVKLGS